MKRVLFVCCTNYQIFNAINYTSSFKKKEDVYDLIICNHFPTAKSIYDNCSRQKLWNSCYYMRTEYKRSYLKTMRLISNLDYSAMIEGKEFTWNYDEVFIGTFNNISSIIAYRYCKKCNKKLFLLDEGIATYLISDFASGFKKKQRAFRKLMGQVISPKKVAGVFLYEPKYYCGRDDLKCQQLPKINRENEELKSLINESFGVKTIPQNEGGVIFFDQPLGNLTINNVELSYSDFLKSLIGKLNEYTSGKYVIKWHPRTSEQIRENYSENSIHDAGVSWELFLLNMKNSGGNTYITIFSSAALLGELIFGDDDKIVFLYKLVGFEIGNINMMLSKMSENKNNIFVPEAWEELDRVLQQ